MCVPISIAINSYLYLEKKIIKQTLLLFSMKIVK
jgi:hypothetical protein